MPYNTSEAKKYFELTSDDAESIYEMCIRQNIIALYSPILAEEMYYSLYCGMCVCLYLCAHVLSISNPLQNQQPFQNHSFLPPARCGKPPTNSFVPHGCAGGREFSHKRCLQTGTGGQYSARRQHM